jgi:hypothetical protein
MNQFKTKNITFGYSDSEDRLWLRLQLETTNEASLWLTRRFAKIIFEALSGVIEKSKAPTKPEDIHSSLKKEYYEVSKSTWSPNPQPLEKSSKNTIITGTCTSATIKKRGLMFQLILKTNQSEFTMDLDNNNLIKILVALNLKTKQAGWQIWPNKSWITD